MDSYLVAENGSISCTFATVKGLCFYWFFAAYTKWLNMDMNQVPEREHLTIDDLFADALSFLTNIRNDDNDRLNFNIFYNKLRTIVATVDALKE